MKGRTYLFYACGTSKCDNLDRCSRNMIKIKICILKNYHVLVMLEIPIIYIVNGYLIGLVEPHKVSCSICFPNNCQWIKEIIKPLRRWIQSSPFSKFFLTTKLRQFWWIFSFSPRNLTLFSQILALWCDNWKILLPQRSLKIR